MAPEVTTWTRASRVRTGRGANPGPSPRGHNCVTWTGTARMTSCSSSRTSFSGRCSAPCVSSRRLAFGWDGPAPRGAPPLPWCGAGLVRGAPSGYAARMGSELTQSSPLTVDVFPATQPLRTLADLPGAFALRSSLPDPGAAERRARWTLFGADPFASFRGGDTPVVMDAFRAAAAGACASERAHELGVPFAGGAVGYWAYDYGRRLERLPAVARAELRL